MRRPSVAFTAIAREFLEFANANSQILSAAGIEKPRKYKRDTKQRFPWCRELVCTYNNQHVRIGTENDMIGAEAC